MIGRYTATVDDNPQEHEPHAGDDFHDAENKFNLKFGQYRTKIMPERTLTSP